MVQAIKPDPRAVIVEADETDVSYWPAYAWVNNVDDAIYTAQSYRFTTRRGARATFAFTGSEVWFYSDKNHNHGVFSATIDNEPAQNFSSLSVSLITQQLLFTTKVEPGPHNLIIVNEEELPFGVDYFAYMPLDNPSSSTTASSGPSSASASPPAQSSSIDTWVWLTFIIGLVAIIIGLIIAFFIYRARMRKKASEGTAKWLVKQHQKEGYAQLDMEMHLPPTSWQPPPSSTPPAYVPPQSASRTHSVPEPDPLPVRVSTPEQSNELRPLSVPGRPYVASAPMSSSRAHKLDILGEPASTPVPASSLSSRSSNHAMGPSTSPNAWRSSESEAPQSTVPPYDGRRTLQEDGQFFGSEQFSPSTASGMYSSVQPSPSLQLRR